MKRLLTIAILLAGTVTASAEDFCDGYQLSRDPAMHRICNTARVLAALEAFTPEAIEAARQVEAAKAIRIQQWAARCKPFKRPDANGVMRYEYAHADCGGFVLTK